MNAKARRAARVASVVCGVIRQALADSGTDGLYLIEADSPEARLLADWIAADGGIERFEHAAPRVLVADPAAKTTLLLEPSPSRAAILPLGDLYATQIAALAGDCSLRGPAHALAGRCGVAALDTALCRCAEGRAPEALAFAGLGNAAGDATVAWRRARFARARLGLVPKLGTRTLGIDLLA